MTSTPRASRVQTRPMLSLLLAGLVCASLPDAEAALHDGDPDAALPLLAATEAAGGLTHADLVRLLILRGTAQAFVDDTDGAVATFVSLLHLAPAQALPYDASPRVTFAFEAARAAAAHRRALDVTLVAPAVARLDDPIVVDVERRADADHLVRRVSLWHRNKGAATWLHEDADFSGDSVSLALPARGADVATVDDDGRPGVIVEVALIGTDARGSQVLVSPSPEHPLEVPVGFDAPPPWYANPWMWTGVAVASVVVAGASTAAIVIANLPPDSVAASSTVTR